MGSGDHCERSPGPWSDKNRGDQEGPGRYGWEMKVSFGDETADLPNLMEANVDAVIEKSICEEGIRGLYRGD